MLTVLPVEDIAIDQSLVIRKSLSFFEKLDEVDLTIVEKIEEHGPRNILALSRILNMPKSTVYRRIQKLLNMGLTIEPIINYNKLDLRCGVVLIEPTTGSLVRLYTVVSNIPWFYKFVVANMNTLVVRFYEPRRYSGLVERIVQALKKIGIVDKYYLTYTSIELASSKVDGEYFDKKLKIVKLKWSKWFKNIAEERSLKNAQELKYMEKTLCRLEVDPIDVKIISKLQKNAFQRLKEIGEELNLSMTTILYHYKKHIIERNVILKYTPRIMIYHPDLSSYLIGFISFRNEKALRNFVYTLWNTPILRRVNKVLGDSTIFASILIPRNEIVKFLVFMDTLCEIGIVHSYKLYFAYLKTLSSWTIPSELFKEDYWEDGWSRIKRVILENKRTRNKASYSYVS